MKRGADDVRVVAGLREEFLRRHRKDIARAMSAWDALVARGRFLLEDSTWGQPVPRRRIPRRFRHLPNLYLIPELPHRFRALYSVLRRPGTPVVCVVEWIGDDSEYDELFGY
jgi:hypothetical protein